MDRQARKEKGKSKVVAEIKQKQQSVDDTVMDLLVKDDDLHEELGGLHDDVMRDVRCKTLQKKKENGGLTEEEEKELAKIGGC